MSAALEFGRADDTSVPLAVRVAEIYAKIAPQLTDMDPGDLLLIIESLQRPIGSGRVFLLKELRPGVFVL